MKIIDKVNNWWETRSVKQLSHILSIEIVMLAAITAGLTSYIMTDMFVKRQLSEATVELWLTNADGMTKVN